MLPVVEHCIELDHVKEAAGSGTLKLELDERGCW